VAAVRCSTCGRERTDEFATRCPAGHDLYHDEEPRPKRIRTRDEVPGGGAVTKSPLQGLHRATVIIRLDGAPVTITGDRFLLGRPAQVDSPLATALARYPNVSRKHVEVSVVVDHFLVDDPISTNNTFIDGHPIRGKGPQPLPNNGVLRLARNCELTMTIVRPPARVIDPPGP
jgi:hypothetical protein